MDELRVSYEPDDEWMGKLNVRIASGAYAGEGSAWINPDEIRAFARALDRFPIPSDQPASLEAGHGGSVDGRRPARTLVRVTVRPHGARGHLVVRAELETETWTEEDSDLQQSVVACFMTEYGLVERFARSLEKLAVGGAPEAVLGGAGGG